MQRRREQVPRFRLQLLSRSRLAQPWWQVKRKSRGDASECSERVRWMRGVRRPAQITLVSASSPVRVCRSISW